MEDNVYQAALAGLLHDVGKFAQRAGETGTRLWDDEARNDFRYYHALLTSDFIDQLVPEPWRVAVKNAAGNHHRPSSLEEAVIALADRLSAGERADPDSDDRASQPRQLLSIFCSLEADRQMAPVDLFWPITPLGLAADEPDNGLFPGPAWESDKVWKAYEELWQDFRQQAMRLRDAHQSGAGLDAYLESMSLLLQRFTWCMPSAYFNSRPDISLHDHDRMTAALAAILTGSAHPAEELSQMAQSPQTVEEDLALLIGGDISGVQEFLYTITSRGATSALRGRSFYLQLLSEAVTRYILDELELPATNLIYAGGGNFYLLARPTDAERLGQIQQEISQVLLYHHRGDLYLALAQLPLRGTDFFQGAISPAWGRLAERLQRAKQRRFSELGDDLAALFRPQGHGGNQEKQCQVCGGEHPQTEVDPKTRSLDPDDQIRKCPQCISYEKLGEDLRRAEILILEKIPLPETPSLSEELVPGDWENVLGCFRYRAALLEEGRAIPPGSERSRLIMALSEKATRRTAAAVNPHTSVGRRFLVNVTPLIDEQEISRLRKEGLKDLPEPGSTKPFHALEAQAVGVKRLGVLRADIDNLGQLFSGGLGERASLSRVAALSFSVSLYFEGWVENLAAAQNRADIQAGLGERLYSIYSGGDDLFFVGSWDAVVELARRVRKDLTRYAAGHLGIHLSAGIALVGGKYPLSQAAEDAHRAMEQAKQLKWTANGKQMKKDAVCFLGQTLPWEKFGLAECSQQDIHTAHALMHLLLQMEHVNPGTATPLIRRLIGLHERYQEALERRQREGSDQNRAGQPQSLWGPWNWLGYYSLSRLFRQRREDSIKELRDQLEQDNFRSIEWIGLAARWAELRLR